jgi:hypothetical protein
MTSTRPTRRLVTAMVIAGVLAVAGPAGAASASLNASAAGIVTDNKDPDKLQPRVHRAGADSPVLMADMGGQYYAQAGPSADGIIAILIGLRHTPA